MITSESEDDSDNQMENLNDSKVKQLRSDNGTEFKNHTLKALCDEKGILQNFSSPCTPKQNGVAKGRNITLIEASRTMLNSASFPKQFWGEAVNAIIWENLMKRQMMDSFLAIPQWLKHLEFSTLGDKKWKKPFMLLSMCQFHKQVLKDRWSREKHIELVNIGEPLAGITTRSRIRNSEAAITHKCLYVNFLSEIKPKKLIEALEEEGWVLAMTEELNQFERNKVWTLVPKPYRKTIIGLKWVFKNKIDEEGVVTKNKAKLVSKGYRQEEGINYDETFAPVEDLKQSESFLPMHHIWGSQCIRWM
nr:retrovirus-related Pol polyprotein from transposon TNT 1-94 [Tanacetum cinerariifolium]